MIVPLPAAALGRVEQRPGLLDLAAEGVGLAVGDAHLLLHLLAGARLVLVALRQSNAGFSLVWQP